MSINYTTHGIFDSTILSINFSELTRIEEPDNTKEPYYGTTTPKPNPEIIEIIKENCSVEDSLEMACQNGQPCYKLTIDSVVNFECECAFPFIGFKCERQIKDRFTVIVSTMIIGSLIITILVTILGRCNKTLFQSKSVTDLSPEPSDNELNERVLDISNYVQDTAKKANVAKELVKQLEDVPQKSKKKRRKNNQVADESSNNLKSPVDMKRFQFEDVKYDDKN